MENSDKSVSNIEDLFKNLDLSKLGSSEYQVPTIDYSVASEQMLLDFNSDNKKKENQRDEWLKTIEENVLAIKNNSDDLILSMEDLIQTIVISNEITEANLTIIKKQLEKIKDNGQINKIYEIKKTTLAFATQKGLECSFIFLLKVLEML